MVNIEQIAGNLTSTRLEFSNIFLRAQDNVGISVLDRYEFEAIVQSADDKVAFREALEFSKNVKGLLWEIVRLAYRDGFYAKGVEDIIDDKIKASLQAISNEEQGYMDTEDVGIGTLTNRRWTGKVLIGGKPKGSGILIGPRRFLTAWHVVEKMFEPVPRSNPTTYRRRETPPVLQIMFDDYPIKVEGRKIAPKPVIVEADKNFCEVFSNCHVDELNKTIPNPTTNLDGYWDYAVIMLAKPMDAERSHARLETRVVVPDDRANIVLLQYPNGKILKMDIDEIISPQPADRAIPDIRFLHQSNADHGSSGGPCFDKEFFLVGLHQGQWPVKLNGRVTNRGVPIRKIIMDMDSQKKASEAIGKPMGPDPDESLIWYTDQKSYDPIIGLDDFQLLIQNIVDTFKQKEVNPGSTGYIWSVQGEPGSGKSYCIDTLFSMLNNTDHMKIRLPGENIAKMDCVKLARFICSEAGTELKGLESFKKYNTTLAAWLRDEVTQKVFRELEEKRGKRMVWICITNLNIHDITGKNTQDFLLFLYECVLQNPWLHIVLDGLRTELPSKLLIATKVYNTHPKTREEIKQYLQRFLRQGPFEKPAPAMIDKFADRLYGPYDAQLKAQSRESMKFLYYQSTALLFQFIEQVQKQ